MSDEARTAKPGYWAVIPAVIRYDDQIPPNAKILYAEISSLIGAEGFCWATDDYFAKVFGFAERTVRDLMAALKAAGYIRVEEERGNHKVLIRRRIYAGLNPLAGAGPEAVEPLADFRQRDAETGLPLAENFQPLAKTFQRQGSIHYKKTNTKDHRECPRTGPRLAPEILPERFEAFWKFYRGIPGEGGRPRNEKRAEAVKAWDRLAPDDALVDRIGFALKRQLQTDEWSHGIGIPMAATYLNQRRWEDAEDLPDEPAKHTNRPTPVGKDVVWV